jgi:hypothetical protein
MTDAFPACGKLVNLIQHSALGSKTPLARVQRRVDVHEAEAVLLLTSGSKQNMS